ncbi:MAG TPA: glycosyl hydrolase [Abditibacteriaceae bacterium]
MSSTSHRIRKISIAAFFISGLVLAVPRCDKVLAAEAPGGQAYRGDVLARGFVAPPQNAQSHTWWHWMNGMVTREGITADLEAMKRVGLGGAQIFDVDQNTPAGPVRYMSTQWRAMVKHAAQEANRLGLELAIHNAAGWSSSGGPWIKPQHAMQMVVTGEQQINGPTHFEKVLPQPSKNNDFYRDIAVLAFRTPESEMVRMADFKPTVTSTSAGFQAANVIDGNDGTYSSLEAPTATQPQSVQFEFAQPFLVRSFSVATGPGTNSFRGQLQASEDGRTFRTLRAIAFSSGGLKGPQSYSVEPTTARFYRLLITEPTGGTKVSFSRIELRPSLVIDNLAAKAAYRRADDIRADMTTAPAGLVLGHDSVLDIMRHMDSQGRLTWDAPPGGWTVLRLGYTPTGRSNSPAPREGAGLECDKMSREAVDVHWAGMMGQITKDLGPLAGKTLNNVLIDSFEMGGQNWTPRFREEFQKRRGYDLLPYLPVLSGRVVDSPAISERFLWDFRRTIADLFTENYYRHFAALCHQNGMLFSVEPYGDGPFEDLAVGGTGDIPMGEFWAGGGAGGSTKLAASVAHIYGRKIVGAESFTAQPNEAGWQNDPYALKALGDQAYCFGINRVIFHTYAHQPWTNRFPGMTMGPWGTQFNRGNTWWNQGAAWLKYQSRCQYLLQQGLFVGDVAYFSGENVPVSIRAGEPALPAGYDYDGCNPEVLLRMTVHNGRITLPHGMSYRVLVLPPDQTMTPTVLRKIRQLVRDGATVVAPKPLRSPSLQNYPQCDAEIAAMASEVWGNLDGKTLTQHAYGKGRVIWGQPLQKVFDSMRLAPDFEYSVGEGGARLNFIHRAVNGADIYFVANANQSPIEVECRFRVSGKIPELWYPDTGRIQPAPLYQQLGGRTTVKLRFDPSGSVFVVFRKAARNNDSILAVRRSGPPDRTSPRANLEIRRALYEATDGAGLLDVTEQLRARIRNGTLNVGVENATFGSDPTPLHVKRLRVEYALDGKASTLIIPEHGFLQLPESDGRVPPPDYELQRLSDGRLELQVWNSGTYQLQGTSGKTRTVAVRNVPVPIEISGAWQLRFPPNLGAPAQVNMDRLISWTEHEQSGVRYFSGTATYVKDIDIAREMLQPGSALYLDLGAVRNLAEVTLNGRNLGTLWKPPFRLDVTSAARPGTNRLEIKVTNLWVNRLIGDEQLPDDRQWAGSWAGEQLQAWPQWLLEGKPSPTGRITFTTWHHWTKDSSLLTSGLLGPVTLRPVRRVVLGLP